MDGIPREESAAAHLLKWKKDFSTAFQYYLDRSLPYYVERWIGTLVIVTIYALRLYFVKGFYLILYGLGIYVLNLMVGFLSPKVDPEREVFDGAMLPSKGSDEFKPFVRRLPEFKFWYSVTKAFCAALVLTFFSVLDVPVFWPILLCFWLFLLVATMQTQILHMRKYKYVPFSIGKKIHSKRRNRLEHKRLNDLVYVRYNQILHHRYKKRDSIDPISLKDIDDSNEWLTGQMESLDLDEGGDGTGAPDLVFPGEDLDWAMVSEAAGVDEPQARTRAKGKAPASTSNVYQRRGRARQAQVEEEEEEDVDVDEDEDEDEEEEFVCDDNDSDDYPEEDATYDNDSP